MVSYSGGGGGLPPGVRGDGATPGGLLVAGDIILSEVRAEGDEGAVVLRSAGLTISKAEDIHSPIFIQLTGGSSGAELLMVDNNSVSLWEVDADGTQISAKGVGFWTSAPPDAQPLLATGAAHTVDDVITLLQSYGICKQA